MMNGDESICNTDFNSTEDLWTIAERTSSRLRTMNDRSVPRVISSDAEDASHLCGSYPSKQKYKLDSSSLHEDHEDDENAEIEVRQQSHLDSFYADLKSRATLVVEFNERERNEDPVSFLNSLYN